MTKAGYLKPESVTILVTLQVLKDVGHLWLAYNCKDYVLKLGHLSFELTFLNLNSSKMSKCSVRILQCINVLIMTKAGYLKPESVTILVTLQVLKDVGHLWLAYNCKDYVLKLGHLSFELTFLNLNSSKMSKCSVRI